MRRLACVDVPALPRSRHQETLRLLIGFSPTVEPAPPGLFWLDPNGMQHLYPSLAAWAAKLYQALHAQKFAAALVVGFHRYRLVAVTRQREGITLLNSPDEERHLAAAAALSILDLPAKLCQELALLGIHTLGDLLNIPEGEVAARYGKEAARFCALMREPAQVPLRPWRPVPPLRLSVEIDPADSDQTRLLFALKGLIDKLVGDAAARWQAVAALHLEFTLDHASPHHERIAAAQPTRDAAQLLELVRLRLAATRLAAAVSGIAVELIGADYEPVQQLLAAPQRDLAAAGRALARLHAAFGAGAASVAELKPEHLPEASYTWRPVHAVRAPQPQDTTHPLPLVRGILSPPTPLPPRPVHEPEAWLAERGVVTQMWGPYRIAGLWWRQETERDYYFVETQAGDLLWIYYNRLERRWLLNGYVR